MDRFVALRCILYMLYKVLDNFSGRSRRGKLPADPVADEILDNFIIPFILPHRR